MIHSSWIDYYPEYTDNNSIQIYTGNFTDKLTFNELNNYYIFLSYFRDSLERSIYITYQSSEKKHILIEFSDFRNVTQPDLIAGGAIYIRNINIAINHVCASNCSVHSTAFGTFYYGVQNSEDLLNLIENSCIDQCGFAKMGTSTIYMNKGNM